MSTETMEQKGYDAFIELWLILGRQPTATQCPARYMAPDSDERRDFLKGWNRARGDL